MAVATSISDLFFNHDLSRAVVPPKDSRHDDGVTEIKFGFDEIILRDIAVEFIGMVRGITSDLPTTDELLADFFDRI